MDQLNLMPDHVLAEVFENLSPRMIKCCTLVCKRWNEIIGTSKELMGRFMLNLDKSNIEIQEANDLQRRHQIAVVGSIEDSLDVVGSIEDSLDVISRHNLQSLTVHCFAKVKLSLVVDVLNGLKSLKTFKARFVIFIDDLTGTNDSSKKVNSNINILKCCSGIIHVFDCCPIKKLELSIYNTLNDTSKKRMNDFFKKQKTLKALSICEFSNEFLTLPDIYGFKFTLKKFHFSCDPFMLYDSFIKFLNQHKNSLISLKLPFSTDPEFRIELIHKFALENVVNLQHLELGYFEHESLRYFGDELSYNELPAATQITKNLKSLKVRARSTDINENRRFYDMFPNLKCLNFECCDQTECPDIMLLHCISQRCVNVEQLILEHLDDENSIPGIIYFPKLKEFFFDKYNDEMSLCAFINRHSQTLEKLSVEVIGCVTHLIAKEILNCPNLIYLSIGFSQPSFSFLGLLSEISCKTNSFVLDVDGFKGSFRFPDDKAIWDEEIEKFENKFSKNVCDV